MNLDHEVKVPDKVFFRIGEVSQIVGVKAYVLRYWETEFRFLSPGKSNSKHRIYRKSDVENLLLIRHLLYDQKYSIEGARIQLSTLKRGVGLKEARKVKIGIEPEKLESLKLAQSELREILSLCETE